MIPLPSLSSSDQLSTSANGTGGAAGGSGGSRGIVNNIVFPGGSLSAGTSYASGLPWYLWAGLAAGGGLILWLFIRR